jgi:hypothetical protein
MIKALSFIIMLAYFAYFAESELKNLIKAYGSGLSAPFS